MRSRRYLIRKNLTTRLVSFRPQRPDCDGQAAQNEQLFAGCDRQENCTITVHNGGSMRWRQPALVTERHPLLGLTSRV
jgi:hypothetical protein